MKPLLWCLALFSLPSLAPAQIYTQAQLDQKPVLKRHAMLFYPVGRKHSGDSAVVLLSFVVDPAGRVGQVQVVKSAAFHLKTPQTTTFSGGPGPISQSARGDAQFGANNPADGSPYYVASDTGPFDRASVRNVSGWRFEPGKLKSQPVNVRLFVKINFHDDGQTSITQLP